MFSRQKKCYICGKPGCWSTKHTLDERKQAYNKFNQYTQHPTVAYYQSFLSQFEGVEGLTDDGLSETEQLLTDMEIEDYDNPADYPDQYLTELGEVDGIQTVAILNDQSTFHFITKSDIFNEPKESSVFSFNDRYSANVFHGIMPDTGAAGVSTEIGRAHV